MRTRRRIDPLLRFSVAIGLATALLAPVGASAAFAAEPTPRVIAGVHADLVAVGFGDGQLTVGSTASVDGEVAKPLDPSTTVFNLEAEARVSIGRGSTLTFLGSSGEFWIAPQSNPDGALLWPGVNTENIEAGVLDGDELDLSIESVDGPGFLSMYSTDSVGAHTRLLDSRTDSGFTSWTLDVGQHSHANWAFSATGEYEVTFGVTASVGGVIQTQTQAYAIHVGSMVPAAPTTVSAPTASTSTIAAGSELTLSAVLEPATAAGWVDFRIDSGNVGEAEVIDGVATITTSSMPIGRQAVTAHFAPHDESDFTPSSSTPTIVTVESSRQEGSFSIAPLKTEYVDGETVEFRAVGDALAPGESYQWVMRFIDGGEWETIYDDFTYRVESGSTLTRVLTTDYNGYEIGLQIVKSFVTVAQSAPVAPVVTGESTGTGVEVRLDGFKPQYPYAAYADLTVAGADLPDGARYEWLTFYPRTNDPYKVTDFGIESTTRKNLYVPESSVLPIGVQMVAADGTVLGVSPRYTFQSDPPPTMQLEGIKSFYHPGDEISLTAHVTPADSEYTTYRWSLYQLGKSTVIEGATGPTVTLPATLALNKATLSVVLVEPTVGEHAFAYAGEELIVLDPAAADVLYFNQLARHYHSGDRISLSLVSSSASPGDTYSWYIKRADQADFSLISGATGTAHTLTGEVALAGAQVKVELVSAERKVLAVTPTVSIAVDDHGSPPARSLAVKADAESYAPSTVAMLTATASPSSILDRYEWWGFAGNDSPRLLGVTRSDTYSLDLDSEYTGMTVFARLTKDTGETYIQSDRVSITLSAPDTEPTPEPTTPAPSPEPVEPTPTPTPTPTEPADPTDPHAPTEPSVPSDPAEPALPADRVATPTSQLTSATRVDLDITDTVRAGDSVRVAVGSAHAGRTVAVWLHSSPRLLVEGAVSAAGTISVVIPSDTAAGSHRLVVQDDAGALIGWDSISVSASAVGGALAATGVDTAAPLAVALLFLAAGGGVLLMRRARRVIRTNP